MFKLLSKLVGYVLPFTCILCGSASDIHKDLCQGCLNDLPWLKFSCLICANPLPEVEQNSICGQCQQQSRFFHRTLSPFHYQYPIDRWILALKFHHQLNYAKLLGELFADYIKNIYSEPMPEVLIPVPLHTQRLRERGFNQALELTWELSKLLKIPINYKDFTRVRYTKTQSLLTAKQRHGNVYQAFACSSDFKATHVAIIDDVMTTGETLNSLSQILQEQNVKKIDIWCIARAGLTPEKN